MGAAQLFEDFVVIRLNAQAHPVEALGPEPVEQLVGNGVGIAFKGDLGVVVHVEIPADGGQDDGKTVGPKEAGGAAAEVDGVHLIAGGQGTGLLDVGADGIQIAVHQLVILAGQRVEVAILALTPAEGHMNVQAKRGLIQSFR